VDSRNPAGETALMLAVLSGHRDLVSLLLQKGADVNARSALGETPLHWAAATPYTDIVEMLLNHGAKIEAQDDKGNRPLHWAAMHSRKAVAELLITKRARVVVRNKGGRSPMDLAFERRSPELEKLLWSNAGVPQDAADPTREPEKHRMLQNREAQDGPRIPIGQGVLTVSNEAGIPVLVICNRGQFRGWFFVEPNQVVNFYVRGEVYRISVVYADSPAELCPLKNADLRPPLNPIPDGTTGMSHTIVIKPKAKAGQRA
jgi:hypothetical protein